MVVVVTVKWKKKGPGKLKVPRPRIPVNKVRQESRRAKEIKLKNKRVSWGLE